MLILIKLVALLMTVFGLSIFASPQFTQRVFQFFKEGNRIYYAGVIRAVVGLFILMSASKSVVPVAATSLGVIFLLSGIVVFAGNLEKMKAFLEHYSQMPTLVVRLLGLIAATFGILVFSIF